MKIGCESLLDLRGGMLSHRRAGTGGQGQYGPYLTLRGAERPTKLRRGGHAKQTVSGPTRKTALAREI